MSAPQPGGIRPARRHVPAGGRDRRDDGRKRGRAAIDRRRSRNEPRSRSRRRPHRRSSSSRARGCHRRPLVARFVKPGDPTRCNSERMGQKTDAQLIADARLDAEAFADLYRRHVKRVYVWLRQRAPDVDASELTAETFAQAAVSLKRFRAPDSGSALPWLIGIANNLLKRYYER